MFSRVKSRLRLTGTGVATLRLQLLEFGFAAELPDAEQFRRHDPAALRQAPGLEGRASRRSPPTCDGGEPRSEVWISAASVHGFDPDRRRANRRRFEQPVIEREAGT